jgi:hypothetical protein
MLWLLQFTLSQKINVAVPHHFYAATGKNFDVAPAPTAPAPAPTLLYSKAKFLNIFYVVYMILYDLLYIAENMN